MTTEAVKEVIGRAIVDEDYRAQLLEEPDEALAEYDLTDEERAGFDNLTAEAFAGDDTELETRLSRSFAGFVQTWT